MSETAIFPFLFLYENVDVEWCIAVFNRYILYLISILKVITIYLRGMVEESILYLISILKVITMS